MALPSFDSDTIALICSTSPASSALCQGTTPGNEAQAGEGRGDSSSVAVPSAAGSSAPTSQAADAPSDSPSAWASSREKAAAKEGESGPSQQQGGAKTKPAVTGRLQSGRGRGRGRGKLVGGAGSYGQSSKSNDAWTGAGFDVDDDSYL